MRSRFVFRIRLIALFFVVIVAIFFVQLYLVQIVRGHEYRAKAEAQYVKQSSNQIDRGTIFFIERDGKRLAAATLASGYTIALNPSQIADPAAAYDSLKEFMPDLERASFMEKAGKKSDVYEEVRRRVPNKVGDSWK